jgi:energy-coupling factor transporter ATP-binding protein EcfA2
MAKDITDSSSLSSKLSKEVKNMQDKPDDGKDSEQLSIHYKSDNKKKFEEESAASDRLSQEKLVINAHKKLESDIVHDIEILKNAFNQQHNPNYYYQASDITLIQRQIMQKHSADFVIHEPIGNDHAIQPITRKLIASLDLIKPTLCIYNLGNFHWVTFAALRKAEGSTIVLYKDSLGYANLSFEKQIRDIDKTVQFIVNNNQEQTNGVDCGIFALQNMQVMATKLSQGQDEFVKVFAGFKGFCNLVQARELRENTFAKELVIGKEQEMNDELVKAEKLMQLRSQHQSEAEAIVTTLKKQGQELFGIYSIKSFSNKLQSETNTIYVDIATSPDTDLESSNYIYQYRIALSKDLKTSSKEIAKNINKALHVINEGSAELAEFNSELAMLINEQQINIIPKNPKKAVSVEAPLPYIKMEELIDNLSLGNNQSLKHEVKLIISLKKSLPEGFTTDIRELIQEYVDSTPLTTQQMILNDISNGIPRLDSTTKAVKPKEEFTAKSNLREKAAVFQRFFKEAILIKGINKEESYFKISDTIKFIKDVIEPFTANQGVYDNTVFVMGPSGVGKSTLMNYIAGKDLFLKKHGNVLGIFPQNEDSIAYVGKGGGSTTLAPNIWSANTQHLQGTTFIDCAGDFDSSGTIIEIINSKIKLIIAQNARNAKVLIVTSQDSLGASGSYGKVFKEGLEKSAQFLSNISYFEDSIGLIVSHAGRREETNETIEACLRNVISNPQVERYKTTLDNLLTNKYMTTFSKYSDEIAEGAIYTPPDWNANQRRQIIDLINKITFKPIPSGLFSDSSSPEVREQMGKAFEILKDKAIDLLQISIGNALQHKIVIHAAGLKNFVQFIEEGIICSQVKTGLVSYVQYLNKHKFFSITSSDEIKKLNEELEFVAQFTKNHGDSNHIEEEWSNLIGTNILFKELLDDAKLIIHQADGIFSSFVERNKLITIGCFGKYSEQLKAFFTNLHAAYKDKASIESHKNDDKYYCYPTEKQFKGMKQVSYTEQETYWEPESYTKTVPYQDVENYTEKRLVEPPATDTFAAQVGFYPYRLRDLYPGEFYKCPYINSTGHIVDSYSGNLIDVTQYDNGRAKWYKEKSLDPVYTYRIIKIEGGSYYKFYTDETKARAVMKERTETDYKQVKKDKTVTKHRNEPEFHDVKVKKFDETKYNKDIKEATTTIDNLKKHISDTLNCIKQINIKEKQNLQLKITDSVVEAARKNCLTDPIKSDGFKELFKELNEEWKYLEYESQALLDYQMELAGGCLGD